MRKIIHQITTKEALNYFNILIVCNVILNIILIDVKMIFLRHNNISHITVEHKT